MMIYTYTDETAQRGVRRRRHGRGICEDPSFTVIRRVNQTAYSVKAW